MNRKIFLQQLLETRFNGSQAAFARAIKRSPAQVHQWLSGYRTLGNAGARHIELTLALPAGWMDGVTESAMPRPLDTVLSAEKRELLNLFNALPKSEQADVITVLKEKKKYYDARVEEILEMRKTQAKQRGKRQPALDSAPWEAEGIVGDLILRRTADQKSKKAG
jgi:hypothetical protein